jgi:hypothetical protein
MFRIIRLTQLACLSLCITSTSARAVEFGVSGTNTVRYGNGDVNNQFDNTESKQIYREELLDVDFSWRNFTLNFAGAIYSPAELPDNPLSERINDEGLIRYSLEYQKGNETYRLGKSRVTFGNGLALSLYRDDNLDNPFNTTAGDDQLPTTWDSGAAGFYFESLRDSWSFRALGGDSDYYGRLMAANAEYFHDLASFGVSYVRADETPRLIAPSSMDMLDLESREIYATTNLAGLEITLNHVDQIQHDDFNTNAGQGGLATYASVNGEYKEWFFLAEYKYYRFAQESQILNNAPIVQREIPTRLLARKRRQNIFNDETGIQLDLSRYFSNGQELAFSGAWVSRIDDSFLPKFEERFDAYQEYTAAWNIEFDHEHHLGFTAAYAEETNGYSPENSEGNSSSWYRRNGLGLSLLTPVPLMKSMEFNAEFMHKRDIETDESSSATMIWADVFPLPDLSINATADYEEHSDANQDWMFSTEVRYDFPTGKFMHHNLTFFYGRLRGGLVCSSGNCRQVAPFNGGKVTLITTF